MKEDAELLLMVADHYRRLWQVMEELETLLWWINFLALRVKTEFGNNQALYHRLILKNGKEKKLERPTG